MSPILGLANAPIVETKFLELAMSLLDFSPRIPLGTFSILLRVNYTICLVSSDLRTVVYRLFQWPKNVQNYLITEATFYSLGIMLKFREPQKTQAVYCFICGRKMVTVARYRMICLVLSVVKSRLCLMK